MSRAGLTRARVLALAGDLADAEGVEALTLARLAQAAGVRSPSLYKHVGGLPDVLASLTVQAYEALGEVVAGLPPADDPPGQVRALAHAWRAWARAHPGRYALATRTHLAGDDRVRTAGEALAAEVVARVGALGLEGDDRVHATRAFRALVHGFVALEAAGGFGLGVDVDASFTRAVDALVAGWAGQARQGSR